MLGGATAAPPDLKRVDVNDTSLAYVEAGHGAPVVLVHGAFGDYRTWSGEMDDFSAQYHVIAYSLRHHYPDTWTEGEYSVRVHVADLTAFLQTLNLGPVHLVGHSYGGVIVANVAKDHPELIHSVILAEATIISLIANNEEAKPLLAQIGKEAKSVRDAVQNGELDQAITLLMDAVNAPNGGFKGLPSNFQSGMLQNTSTLKPYFGSPPPPTFTCEDAMKIAAPTLLVSAELSHQFRRLIDSELERCIPQADRAIIPGTGHPLEMNKPTEFNAAVLRFLARH
jgi:pimeloyl-ACP methyl ester carboxylesterase